MLTTFGFGGSSRIRGLFGNTFKDSKGTLNFASHRLENMSLRCSLINGQEAVSTKAFAFCAELSSCEHKNITIYVKALTLFCKLDLIEID